MDALPRDQLRVYLEIIIEFLNNLPGVGQAQTQTLRILTSVLRRMLEICDADPLASRPSDDVNPVPQTIDDLIEQANFFMEWLRTEEFTIHRGPLKARLAAFAEGLRRLVTGYDVWTDQELIGFLVRLCQMMDRHRHLQAQPIWLLCISECFQLIRPTPAGNVDEDSGSDIEQVVTNGIAEVRRKVNDAHAAHPGDQHDALQQVLSEMHTLASTIKAELIAYAGSELSSLSTMVPTRQGVSSVTPSRPLQEAPQAVQPHTSLHKAATDGDLEEVKQLLAQDPASLNRASATGDTPFALAAQNGHAEVVEHLSEQAGIDLNPTDENGYTPLLSAASAGHASTVKTLVSKADCDLSARDNENRGALIQAAMMGHLAVMEILIPRITARASAQQRQRALALLDKGFHQALDFLKEAKETNSGDRAPDPIYPLDMVDEDEISLYLKQLNSPKKYAKTIEFWVEKVIGLEAIDREGFTALLRASDAGHLEAVRLLLASKAIIDAPTRAGRTSLMLAAEKGYLDVVKLLVSKGAALGAEDNDQNTALIMATAAGHDEVVRHLSAAANSSSNNSKSSKSSNARSTNSNNSKSSTSKSSNGSSSGGSSSSGSNLTAGRRQVCHSAEDKNAFLEAVKSGQSHIVKRMVQEDIDLQTKDPKSGNTALIWAGCDIHVANNNQMTALHQASHGGFEEIVELLLKKGAKVNASAINGITPLMMAAEKGHVRVVQLLLKQGADRFHRTTDDETALDWAREEGHQSVIEALTAEDQAK